MRVRLDRDHLTIGRLSSNDIALPYPHISRQHAELRLMGQTWWIVDLRSTNGLHVSGQRVSESKLAAGAVVMLSPLISLSLLDEAAQLTSPLQQGYPQAYSAPPHTPPHTPPQAPMHAATPTPAYPSYGGYGAYPAAPAPSPAALPMSPMSSPAPAHEPITPLSALGPRSPYADDEAPFYPQMRQAEHARFAPSAPSIPPMRQPQPVPHAPAPAPIERGAAVDVQPFEPMRQAGQFFEQRRTARVAPSPLLHVCQTCGQRTMPDAVYCQNCHHSIASECARCRLSLLPVQDLCPRCQTPNPYSVRRFRHAAGPS